MSVVSRAGGRYCFRDYARTETSHAYIHGPKNQNKTKKKERKRRKKKEKKCVHDSQVWHSYPFAAEDQMILQIRAEYMVLAAWTRGVIRPCLGWR